MSLVPKRPVPALPSELWLAIVMQLPPRHLYQLMQTNEKLYEVCRSESYWRRVALPLVWGWHPATRLPRDMVFLSKSYNDTMEDFIKGVRLYYSIFDPATAKASLRNLLRCAQGEYMDRKVVPGEPVNAAYLSKRFIPGETAFQLVKRIVEDSDGVPAAAQRIIDDGKTPVETGLITAKRHATRAVSTFLRSLEDEPSMDLDSRRRVLESVRTLFGECCGLHFYADGSYDEDTEAEAGSGDEDVEVEKITRSDLQLEDVGKCYTFKGFLHDGVRGVWSKDGVFVPLSFDPQSVDP